MKLYLLLLAFFVMPINLLIAEEANLNNPIDEDVIFYEGDETAIDNEAETFLKQIEQPSVVDQNETIIVNEIETERSNNSIDFNNQSRLASNQMKKTR